MGWWIQNWRKLCLPNKSMAPNTLWNSMTATTLTDILSTCYALFSTLSRKLNFNGSDSIKLLLSLRLCNWANNLEYNSLVWLQLSQKWVRTDKIHITHNCYTLKYSCYSTVKVLLLKRLAQIIYHTLAIFEHYESCGTWSNHLYLCFLRR